MSNMEWQEVVSNYEVYGLEDTLIASGLPMITDIEQTNRVLEDKDIKRGHNLSVAADTDNPAHAQFLSGIIVNFNMTFTNKGWVEAERYRFLTFVSSQSTMHRITKFDLDEQYIEYVDPRIIEIMKEKIDRYNTTQDKIKQIQEKRKSDNNPELLDELAFLISFSERQYLEILYSNPAGFKLTARMTTNYRCLKNIYIQRKNHRLPEWLAFCAWIEQLPYFEELINTKNT